MSKLITIGVLCHLYSFTVLPSLHLILTKKTVICAKKKIGNWCELWIFKCRSIKNTVLESDV